MKPMAFYPLLKTNNPGSNLTMAINPWLHKLLIYNMALMSCANYAWSCELPGEPIQWIADYCLLINETDDLVAAQPCIDAKLKHDFTDDCETMKHYKALMCAQMVTAQLRQDSTESCIGDADLMGNVTRNNGL